jgi:PAS domain S-box-containing protein
MQGKLKEQNKLEANSPIFEITHRAGLVLDKLGNITNANPAALHLLGYTLDQITQKTIQDINPTLSLYNWKDLYKSAHQKIQITKTEIINKQQLPLTVRSEVFGLGNSEECMYLMDDLTEATRNEELLNLITRISHIGAWEWDINSKEALITKESFNLLSKEQEQRLMSGKKLNKFLRTIMSKDNIYHFKSNMLKLMRNGGRLEFEIDAKQKNGGKQRFIIYAELKTDKILDKPVKIVGTIQDISKVSERSNDMYLADYTINKAEELIYWINSKAELTFFNNAVIKTFGYSRKELKKMSVPDLDPNFPMDKFDEIFEELKRKKYVEVESVNQRKNGELFPVNVRLYHTYYNNEDFMVTYARDISDEIKKKQFIELSNITLNQSQDLILWCRSDGSIYYQNKTLLSLIHTKEKDLSKLKINDLLIDFDFDTIWKEKQKVHAKSFRLRTKLHKEVLVEVAINFISHLDEELACIILTDITERKQTKLQLQHALDQISQLKEQIESEKNYLIEEVSANYNFNNIISKSPAYKKVLSQVTQVADSSATVLITGETGTGKELLARAVHSLSKRTNKPLVKVNCASLPPNLIESALFGHEKGSFTGAHERKIGRFELAHEGTIFLDEIGELPIDLQPKLLRVLQEGEIVRVGSPSSMTVDVRIIAATNRNLEEMVNEGKFREDLYYRLNVFPIHNLPLRQRKDDIPLLIQYFIDKYGKKNDKPNLKVPKSYIDALLKYDFPGNIRELENIVERSIILSNDGSLSVGSLSLRMHKLKGEAKDEAKEARNAFLNFEEMQKEHIMEALRMANWKITGDNSASTLLELNGKTLSSKMRKLGIKKGKTF